MESSENINIGVWLDSDNALVVTLSGESHTIDEIKSNVDHINYAGGRGSATPNRFQAVKSEKNLLEKKKHQFQLYFQDIYEKVKTADKLLIFGPAETKTAFLKMLLEYKTDRSKITIETADSLTDNQVVAYIKKFFNPE